MWGRNLVRVPTQSHVWTSTNISVPTYKQSNNIWSMPGRNRNSIWHEDLGAKSIQWLQIDGQLIEWRIPNKGTDSTKVRWKDKDY